MLIINKSIRLNTSSGIEVINITQEINEIIKESDISNGLVNIFTEHTTSGIMINEDEEGLKKDYVNFLEKTVPEDNYFHDLIDNNASSHLKSMIASSNQTVPLVDSKLNLGIWQSIFFVELDGPRSNRVVNITIVGN